MTISRYIAGAAVAALFALESTAIAQQQQQGRSDAAVNIIGQPSTATQKQNPLRLTQAVGEQAKEVPIAAGTPGTSRSQRLAKQILDDLRGAGYYADPKILADVIRRGTNTDANDERNAIEVIQLLLRTYGTGTSQRDQVEERLAESLEAIGVH